MSLNRQQQAEIRARIALAVNILNGVEKNADNGKFEGIRSSLYMISGALDEVHTIIDGTDVPLRVDAQTAIVREEYDDIT